jgi:high-affinity Fe2+/Pb2+ permease
MNDESGVPSSTERRGGERAPSGSAIALMLAGAAVAIVLGYLFLMKLIDISRQGDCLLAHRRDCATGEPQ